ncbi:MAG: hypothetical protein JWQ07_3246 [Ramlibacter sp.]|nr:hypothetical protein [Ramlibacter sp.]
MKFSPALLIPLCAVLFAATAGAQLKMPRNAPLPAVPAAAAPAATAPAAAPDSSEKEAAGKLAAQGWLILLDRRDWGRAWETASGVFRNSVPLPSWMDGIPKVRESLGSIVERTPAESVYKTSLEGRPEGEYVTAIFLSKFDQRELQEVVTVVREGDGKWRVTGYSTR